MAKTQMPSSFSLNGWFSKYGPKFPEVKTIFIVIVRYYLHYHSFSQECTMEFSGAYIHVISQKIDRRIHLPSLKSDIKEICKNLFVKALIFFLLQFCLANIFFHKIFMLNYDEFVTIFLK